MIALALVVLSITSDSNTWEATTEDASIKIETIHETVTQAMAHGFEFLGYPAGTTQIELPCTTVMANDVVIEKVCAPGIMAYDPGMYGTRYYSGAGEELYEGLEAEPFQLILTWSDVAVLPIQSGTIDLQPGGGRHLINVETIAHSTATEHTLAATVLDIPVEVRLTPLEWSWHFGQDIPDFTTTTPGGQYPDLSVSGIYTDVAEGLTVTTTITWEGEFRIADSPNWYPVFGRGTTTVTSAPFDTYEYRTYLLHDPRQPDPEPDDH